MYLSKLEILGFKSFAQKTNIVLNDGITAIVGPNGCGKTNIVDALRWALGEQRYSTLRSDKMEDVIFNGTKSRKPINLAEVSLTIQNNKGILPVEYNELTITRRVFRSGESDYLLNRTVCRLKDIVSLFMDTGMGSNAYSVIELKMVETILSDKMEERRRLFEEAAGVTKYKVRRKEAFRKLTDVEADLLRVDDIIAEVSKSVNSLNRQAKKAERYNEYLERLRALEIDVLQRDYTSLLQRLDPLEKRLAEAIIERDSMRGRLEQEESLLNVYRAEEREIEERLESSRKDAYSVISRINELEQALVVNQERERSLRQTVERLTVASGNYSIRLKETDEAQKESEEKLESMNAELAALETETEKKRSDHLELEEIVSQKKLEAQSRQARQMRLVQEISRIQNELEKADARSETISATIDRLLREEEEAKANLASLSQRLAEEDSSQIQLTETAVAAEREFHDMEDRKQAIRMEIDQLQNRAFEIQGQIGEKMTKIDFLVGLVDRLEGYSESVQHLLKSRDWRASQFGTIADAVNTADEYRVAVEAALGEAAHYIVVNDITEAISGLQNLKNTRKGKATFACLSRIPQTKAVPFPIAGDGVIGWAADLVKYAPQHHALYQFLLKNTLIVRDAEVANSCIREYPQTRCVTISGDVFDSNGIVRGGSHGQEEGGLIGKKDQIAQLTKEVEELKRRLSENQVVLEEKNFDYGDIDLKRYAENMKQRQQELSAHERQVAQMMYEVEKFNRIIEKNAEERAALDREHAAIEERRLALQPTIEDLLAQQTGVESEVNQETEVLRVYEKDYQRSNEELNKVNVAFVQKKSEIQNLRNEIDRFAKTRIEVQQALEQAEYEITHAAGTADALAGEITIRRQKIEELSSERLRAEECVAAIESELAVKRSDAERVDKALHEERQKHNQSVTLVHEIELKVSEIRQRIEGLIQHAQEDFELTLESKEAAEDDVFDLAQAKEEIRDLRMRIKSLGLVNPLAFEEWKQEKERLDLLTSQRQDLIDSRHTLNDTIAEINQTAQQKFQETFSLIRENFISIFKSLFDEGDEADLILEENSDPLEARIEITAKPRGKRPHSIEMLSGGEKTLTAIALLFAIYLVKPSPFCILDEVDAPLDDANIDRFVRILRSFADNTQFIVVTHNKRTMAAADTLYGVTMEEEGVSKIVAVDFHKDNVARFTNN